MWVLILRYPLNTVPPAKRKYKRAFFFLATNHRTPWYIWKQQYHMDARLGYILPGLKLRWSCRAQIRFSQIWLLKEMDRLSGASWSQQQISQQHGKTTYFSRPGETSRRCARVGFTNNSSSWDERRGRLIIAAHKHMGYLRVTEPSRSLDTFHCCV